MNGVVENIQILGPILAVVWTVTILCTVLRPQRFFNSFLVLFSILVTLLFVSGLFGDGMGYALLVSFILVMIGLFLVPVLLIINGIQMIRKESATPAHLLSLGLGIVIGIGEIAAIIYVLGLTEMVNLQKANVWILLLVFTVFYFSMLVLSFVIYSIFIQLMPHRMNFDYVIIHGCGLAGGERVTRLLSNRIDKAIEIYKKCRKKPVIIPSGGRGSDEKISEAEAMKNYLLEHGIPAESVVMEDQSTTTWENLTNSKAIIDAQDGRKKTALISSNYHVYRCLRLARQAGLKCTGIGADVASYYWPSALIREFIAVFLQKKFLLWSLIGYVLFISPILYLLITDLL